MIPLRWLPRILLIMLLLAYPFAAFLELIKPLFFRKSPFLMPIVAAGGLIWIALVLCVFFWSYRRWPLSPPPS